MNDFSVVAEVMEFNQDLLPPEGLSERGRQAYDIILSFLMEHDLTFTGGCPAFVHPDKWDGDYGKNSILIVLHDGGDVGRAFSLDKYEYDLVEAMDKKLEKIGLYSEQCTLYQSAIYEVKTGPGQRF